MVHWRMLEWNPKENKAYKPTSTINGRQNMLISGHFQNNRKALLFSESNKIKRP